MVGDRGGGTKILGTRIKSLLHSVGHADWADDDILTKLRHMLHAAGYAQRDQSRAGIIDATVIPRKGITLWVFNTNTRALGNAVAHCVVNRRTEGGRRNPNPDPNPWLRKGGSHRGEEVDMHSHPRD